MSIDSLPNDRTTSVQPYVLMACQHCGESVDLVDGLCIECQEMEEVMLPTAPTEQQMESMAEAS